MKRTGQSKIAVVGWGRGMGHKGHMYLADAVITQAQAMNADPYFFVSKTVGKDDPIFPEEKVRIYQKVFPQHASIFTPEGNLNQALTELATLGYQGVIVVVGADQKQAFQYLEKPNKEGVPVYQSIGLKKLRVISRQETNSKFSNEEGPRATPMREILLDPNSTEEQKFATWRRDMPEQLSDREVLDVMNKAESRLLQLSVPKSATKVQAMSKKQTKLKESLIMDRDARVNAYYVSRKGDKHRVAENIPYYLLDKLVPLLTKKYAITMNDIEVRPADKTQYRRSGLPELAEGIQCNPNEVAELLYNAKPEIFTKFGDEFVMNAIEQACEQHQGSAQEVAGKAVEILKQGISEAYDHNAPFNAADFNRHMAQLRAREELRKTDPMRALVGDLIDKDNAARNVKKKPQDDSSIDINDPRHPGWGALHNPLGEGSSDTIYPNAEVIKSKNGKPVGEIYQDANGWGCFHYKADNGADSIGSKEEALEWLKDLHDEYRQDRNLREQGVDESPEEALKYATKAHAGQTRSGGDPYITHPMRVADHIRQYKQSHNLDALISAAYLHDTIEDTDTTQEVLHDLFGGLVASLVKELTSDPEQIKKMGKAAYLSHKMAAMSSYGLVIKLADRLDNVKDITTARTPQWRAKYAAETNQILDYIEKTRALSGTHNKLISLIRAKLAEIDNPPQQDVAGGLNEFAPDGFNGGDDDEGFSPEIAKMAQEDGFIKGVSLADGATLERAMTINYWHSQQGGMYKQYFAKGFKEGRMNKVNHDNKQYNLNLKLMKDGSIRHGEQGVAEESGISRRGILKGIAGASALGAAGKASAIAGAFPTPSAQQAMYKAAADSNAAQARADAAEKAKRDAQRLQQGTADVERLNKINYHGGKVSPANASWDGDSDFLDLDGTKYSMASRMPIRGDEPRDMKLISTREGRQVYIWTRNSLKGVVGRYFYPAPAGSSQINEFAPDGFDGFEDDNRVPMHCVVEKDRYNRRSKWKKSRDADGVILFSTKQQAIQAAEKFNKIDPNREFAYGGTQMVHVDDDLNEFAKPEDNRPEAEYEVYLLDPKALRNKKLSIMGEPMLRTDNLAQACTLIYKFWNKTKHPICVWQPSKGFFRDYYMDPAVNWMDEYGNEKSELNEFAPGNGDDGLPYAEYQVYQCNPEDQFDWIGGPLYQTDNMGMAHKYAYEKYVKHRPKAFMVWQERSQGSRGNYGVKGQSDGTEEINEGSQVERKITRVQSMIQDFHNRAKTTKNDIKKNHYLQMADQLQSELDRLISDANEMERDGNMVSQHDSEASDTWNRGGLAEDYIDEK